MVLEARVAEAKQAIHEVLGESWGEPCVTSSFQAEAVVLLDLLTGERPDIPVLFLDTGYHFAETLAYRDRMVRRLGLNLRNLTPRLTVEAQETQFGILHQEAPDRCCAMRKVEPLFAALGEYEVWFAGLRRDQSATRAGLRVRNDFRLPGGKQLLKVCPLADWTARDVWDYLQERQLPLLPLYARGYTSIGCEPCTALPFDPGDPRSGRWGGKKMECGIHIGAS
jgi:phosphoadenosine phosphosulfate reductase